MNYSSGYAAERACRASTNDGDTDILSAPLAKLPRAFQQCATAPAGHHDVPIPMIAIYDNYRDSCHDRQAATTFQFVRTRAFGLLAFRAMPLPQLATEETGMQTASTAWALNPTPPEPARWLRLLAQLDLILTTVEMSTNETAFQRFDSRRRSTSVRHLMLERRRVVRELDAWGLPQPSGPADPVRPTSLPIASRSLEAEFLTLAEAYETCAMAASAGTQRALRTWLLGRAQMHQQQALFLSTF